MDSTNMVTGVLVVGAILPSTEVPHNNHYNTTATPVRANRKSIPIRISVNKHAK